MSNKINEPRLKQNSLGFLQVAKPPSAKDLTAYYRDKYFQCERGSYRSSYSEDERNYIDAKLRQHSYTINWLRGDLKGPGRFLDVGCGEGFALAWFQALGWAVSGIDHSSFGVGAMNPHLLPHVAIGDVFSVLDARVASGERYEVVWLSNVLEHVLDPVALLQSLRRLVTDDGLLVVTVPNDGTEFQEFLLERGDIAHRNWIAVPDHLSYFNEASLRAIAGHTGWNCREMVADFPIDLFLAHPGSNYVRDPQQGKSSHRARVGVELLLSRQEASRVVAFYSAMAAVGLGRQLTAFFAPAPPR